MRVATRLQLLFSGVLAGTGIGMFLVALRLTFEWMHQQAGGNFLAGFFLLLALPFLGVGAALVLLAKSLIGGTGRTQVQPSKYVWLLPAVALSALGTFMALFSFLDLSRLPSVG